MHTHTLEDIITPQERAGGLLVPCHGCRRPVHIADSTVSVVHYHGVECLRRGRERDRRRTDALEQVFSLAIGGLLGLAALGAVVMVLRMLGLVGTR